MLQANRPEWIEFLNAGGLQEIGNDPKRHTPATRAQFWDSVQQKKRKTGEKGAASSGDDSDSESDSDSDSESSDEVKAGQEAAASSEDDSSDSESASDSDSDGDSAGSDEDEAPAAAAAPAVNATATSSDDDDDDSSDSSSTAEYGSSGNDASPAAALAEIKSNRAAWVEWLAANGLSDVGNDPKRQSHQRRVGQPPN